jgi:hypothetical protein
VDGFGTIGTVLGFNDKIGDIFKFVPSLYFFFLKSDSEGICIACGTIFNSSYDRVRSVETLNLGKNNFVGEWIGFG